VTIIASPPSTLPVWVTLTAGHQALLGLATGMHVARMHNLDLARLLRGARSEVSSRGLLLSGITAIE
jgi:hypothetical protein